MDGRFDQFYALEPEKQQRILYAAMEEFAQHGFKRASTNAIVQAAGIGKGMLFYYFGNKEELFEFLCEYALEAPQNFLHQLQFDSDDYLQRYQTLAHQKQQILQQQPQLSRFFESLYRADSDSPCEKFAARLEELRASMHHKLYDGLDYSLLRDDIAPVQAIEYMKWLLERYEQELMEQYKNDNLTQNVREEWQRYYHFLAELRKIFYK